MKAQKKAVIIDYFVHSTKSNEELFNWVKTFGEDPNNIFEMEEGKLKVKTLEGTSYDVPNGYIIIRGVKGEYYPCDPEIFDATYDKI